VNASAYAKEFSSTVVEETPEMKALSRPIVIAPKEGQEQKEKKALKADLPFSKVICSLFYEASDSEA
jgi:hypothetical protein